MEKLDFDGKTVNKSNKKWLFDFCLHICLYALINVSLYNKNSFLMSFAVILTLIYCLFADQESSFAIIVGLSIYEGSFRFFGNSAILFVLAVFVVKFVLSNRLTLKISVSSAIAFFSILLLEILGDFFTVEISQFLIILMYIVFFVCVMCNIEKMNFNVLHIFCSFFASFLLSVVYVFSTYGGVADFLDEFLSVSWAYRFALEEGVSTGGAMAMPLYALMIISIAITMLLVRKNTVTTKMLFVFALMVSVTIGFLTVSRSFLLGLVPILICALFVLATKSPTKTIVILIIIALLLSILIIAFPELVNKIYENFFNRIDADETGGGRLLIWNTCFEYLFEHPLRLIVGCGAANYPSLGEGMGAFDMSAGAHNLLIDIFMSWGILGLISILVLVFYALALIKCKNKNVKFVHYIPFMAYVAFSMTALGTTGFRTWIFLLLCIISVDYFGRKENYDT